MTISPDNMLQVALGPVILNATLFYSWLVMFLMVFGSWLVTRNLTSGMDISRGQNLLEAIVEGVRNQIREVAEDDPDKYLPFVGTLFLFIAISNTLDLIPGFTTPAGSISTTAALAACVFFAVHVFGITERGLGGYLRSYIQPTPIMLPFNVIGEFSRTLALAVRLFGNMMSGTMIVGILLSLIPFIFPMIMQAFGLLIGLIQAYIFAILTMVYIASAVRAHKEEEQQEENTQSEGENHNG
jgi:F-type H+-transporting ATPase subunit a